MRIYDVAKRKLSPQCNLDIFMNTLIAKHHSNSESYSLHSWIINMIMIIAPVCQVIFYGETVLWFPCSIVKSLSFPIIERSKSESQMRCKILCGTDAIQKVWLAWAITARGRGQGNRVPVMYGGYLHTMYEAVLSAASCYGGVCSINFYCFDWISVGMYVCVNFLLWKSKNKIQLKPFEGFLSVTVWVDERSNS